MPREVVMMIMGGKSLILMAGLLCKVDLIGSCAHIAGIFYSEYGTTVLVFPNNDPWILLQGPKGQINQNITKLWAENPNIITPIFDYRSDKHGERVKK